MLIKSASNTFEKLVQIADATDFEPAGDSPHAERKAADARQPRREARGYQSTSVLECIAHLSTPKGKKPVLKTMVTTACEKNCFYCPFRAGRGKTKRVTFKPDELAGAFDTLEKAGKVDGLFLSSGIIKGGVTTQDKIIDTAEIVRKRYGYRGYVHLKIMPGAEEDQILRAMELADRVSINLEGPTEERLRALAPRKEFTAEIFQRLAWAGALRQRSERKLASVVTQFVVGAVGDTDLELLALIEKLYRQNGLARAYYSAFSPVAQTPFEELQAVDPAREFRLYQSSFLLRDYNWDVEDLPFEGGGNLRLDVDPKRAWADQNLLHAPVDLMRADREALLRVPNIGPKSADAILKARRTGRLTDLIHLRQIGIRAPEQIAPYILLDGRRLPVQMALL